jgi:hypothetical protein
LVHYADSRSASGGGNGGNCSPAGRGASHPEKQTVRAGRKANADLRTREYLTEAEVERLIKAAGSAGQFTH